MEHYARGYDMCEHQNEQHVGGDCVILRLIASLFLTIQKDCKTLNITEPRLSFTSLPQMEGSRKWDLLSPILLQPVCRPIHRLA